MAKTKTILLIDDSDDDRDHYKRLLAPNSRHNNYQILEADSGDEGLKQLQSQSVDCVLLDYSLPGQDGLVVLQKIKQKMPYAAIVMLTGEGNEVIAVESMKAGAQDYLVKNKIGKAALVRAVTNAMEKVDLQHKVDEQRQELLMFGQMLAHDLKSPTRSIRFLLEFIKEDAEDKIQGQSLEHMQMITALTNRMDCLVDALSAYTKLNREAEQPQVVAMEQIVEAATTNLHQDILEKNAKIHCQTLPMVEGHTENLIQLLQNLVSNAIKYCSQDPEVHISSQQQDEYFIFSVKDNGIGISPEHLEYIFEPFKRLHSKDKYEGSGIGLATCKKIIQRHKGQIWCQSEPSGGTTFLFSLPISKQLATKSEAN